MDSDHVTEDKRNVEIRLTITRHRTARHNTYLNIEIRALEMLNAIMRRTVCLHDRVAN